MCLPNSKKNKATFYCLNQTSYYGEPYVAVVFTFNQNSHVLFAHVFSALTGFFEVLTLIWSANTSSFKLDFKAGNTS